MPKIHREALLPYSPEALYQLVNDVKCYPEFLPWCHATEIIEQSDVLMRASIFIKKMGIAKTFSTKNDLELNKKINMQLMNGPFKYLMGEWQFIAIQDLGCKIILDLDFEFLPGLMNLPFKKVFEPAADSMLQSFVTRAHALYGGKK
ncbi:MAG: type II toxin-antitoxin system RatA family toxin [Pseudomonadota bacterium]